MGGGNICFFRYEFLVLGVSFIGECDTLFVFFNVSDSIQEVIINKD